MKYQSRVEISKLFIKIVPKESVEKDFIINFLGSLPVEKLKLMVNFKEIDYENQPSCEDYGLEFLQRLQSKEVLLLIAEINI